MRLIGLIKRVGLTRESLTGSLSKILHLREGNSKDPLLLVKEVVLVDTPLNSSLHHQELLNMEAHREEETLRQLQPLISSDQDLPKEEQGDS